MSGVKDGLVWWWDLNSADATITDQHSGLVLTRHQTPTTVVGGAPDGGDCISFGTAQGKYRNASVPKTIAYERGFSANCWAFSTSFSTFGNRLINHRDIAAPNWYFQMGVVHPAIGDWGEVFSAGGTIRSASSGVPASPLNTWVMLTYVDNGTTSYLYRNGVLIATGSTTIGALSTANAPFAIGGHAWQTINDSQLDHRGRMSMAGVWDRPLTADEITWLFNSGAGRRYNTLTFGERDLGGEVLWICPSLDDIGAGTLVARDLTTNRNHGILTNMDPPTDWAADTSNGGVRALDFDGVNDYLSATLASGLSSSFTFSCWVRVRAASGTAVRPWITSQVSSYGNYWASLGTFGNRFSFGLFDGSNNPLTGDPNISAGGIVTLNQWYHVVGVRNTTTDTIALYINGVLDRSVTDTTTSTPTYSALTIGGQTTPAGRYADCQLDDIRVFNRALTQTEITALASQRGYQRPAVHGIGGEALWICPSLDTFGNGTLLARDLTNQRYHGTLTNMVVGDWVSDTGNGGVRALDFDRTTTFISVLNRFLSSTTITNFAISAWVRPRSLYGIVLNYNANSGINYYAGVGSFVTKQRVYVGGTPFPGNDSNTNLTANTWQHICVTRLGSTITFYRNGAADGVVTDSRIPIHGNELSLGGWSNGTETFDGLIDDWRFFLRALSAFEVAALASQRGYQLPSNTRRRRYAGAYGL